MYLLEGRGKQNGGVEVIDVDGDFFVRLTDLESVRNGFGALLTKIQTIKSTGNRKQAEELFDKYGTRLDADWKENVTARKKKLGTPKIKAFVFPRLEPVIEGGEIVDVRIHNDEDLTTQQLRFSGLENSTSIDESCP
jgi:dipeptidyl-peptidase-3